MKCVSFFQGGVKVKTHITKFYKHKLSMFHASRRLSPSTGTIFFEGLQYPSFFCLKILFVTAKLHN